MSDVQEMVGDARVPDKCVYIAHPLGKDPKERELNRVRASKWVAWAGEQGVCPMASWIILSGEWPETDEYRALGLAMDFAQIRRCDEVWLCGSHVSPGMGLEAEYAKKCGIPVVDKRMTEGAPSGR